MKWSNDSTELGASKTAVLVLGESAFGVTPEKLRQNVLGLQNNAKSTTILTPLNKDAIARGNCLEDGLIDLTMYHLKKYCPDDVKIKGIKPTDADRLKDHRIAASCDYKIKITGPGLTLPNPFGEDIAMKGTIPVEIKTDSTANGSPKYDYVIQLNTQMLCMGVKMGLIAVLERDLKFRLYPYKRDEDLCNLILDRVGDFWHRVDHDIPYPPDDFDMPDTVNLDRLNSKKSVIDCIEMYQQCETEIKHWEQEKDNVKSVLTGVMEAHNAQFAEIDGYKINYKIIERKAQPEKVVPAKEATTYRRFSVETKQ